MPNKSYKTRRIKHKQKTTTKAGKNEYMRNYMRLLRKQKRRELRSSAEAFTTVHDAIFEGVKHPEVRKKGQRKKATLRMF